MLFHRLDSGSWSVAVATITILFLVWLDLSFNHWRLLMAIALLMTATMLYHRKLRDFVLLPSSIVLIGWLQLLINNAG